MVGGAMTGRLNDAQTLGAWRDGEIRYVRTIEKPNGQVYSLPMNKKTLSEVMAYLGSQKSPAKARASRKNGKLGGRPRKVKP